MTSSDDLMKELAEALRDLIGSFERKEPNQHHQPISLFDARRVLARYDASRPEGKSEVSK